MLAYNNDKEFKERAVAAAMHHRDADMLISGTYGQMNGKFHGCSVGCDAYDITGKIIDDPHSTTAKYFGFPEWLERLRDTIFEGLDKTARNNWHVDLKKAIPVGMTKEQFESVKSQFILYLMVENIERVKSLAISEDLKSEVIAAIEKVKIFHETDFGDDESAARSAAESAAWSAAWSAAESAARSAAESAARSAA